MTTDAHPWADLVADGMDGATIAGVEPWEFGWTFRFSNGARITTQSIWRALTAQGIAVTSEDHQQRFGLPEPVDAGQRAISTLTGQVNATALVSITGDLRVSFESGCSLEFLNTSTGYEGWQLAGLDGKGKAFNIIALGGGELAIFKTD
jgi:hypothetical protein